jgi:ABC-2 type transport system permease protein
MMRLLRPRRTSAAAAPVPDAVPHRPGERLLPNAAIVARREYTQRVRTRSFLLGTVFLMLAAFGAALIPAVVGIIEGQMTTKLAVYSAAAGLSFDPVPIIETSLNAATTAGPAGPGSSSAPSPTATPGSSASGSGDGGPEFVVTSVTDLDAATAALGDGAYDGLIVITRGAGGDPAYSFVTDAAPDGRTAFYVRQGATAVTLQDRVERLGITATQASGLFAPLVFDVEPADASRPAQSAADQASRIFTSNILVILIFITVITYGTWVAMSVAEEKSSRVMELMLSAATPRQMLAGKVVGTGGAGLTQYAGILAAGLAGIVLQGPITEAILGRGGGDAPALPGLTPEVLVLFVAFFALGFALYALIYAAAGSLVSRQEEVQQVVTPLTFLAMSGYFAAIFAATAGSSALWVIFFSYFPFTSPYVMLVRMVDGTVQPWEPLLSLVILVPSVLAMLVVAARVYSAGVLLYGQRPTFRTMLAAMRIRR